MSEIVNRVPSLAKLGKLANSRKFEALEDAWLPAVASGEYSPAKLMPIAGQVGRLGALDKATVLAWTLLSHCEQNQGPAAALAAARLAAREMPDARELREEILRLYRLVHPDYPDLDLLLNRAAAPDGTLTGIIAVVDAYLPYRVGVFVKDANYLVPGLIVGVNAQSGIVTARYDQRHQDYGQETLAKMQVLPVDHFPALVMYDQVRLQQLAKEDVIGFVSLALASAKDQQLGYRELKNYVTLLLEEKGWQQWWQQARPILKRASQLEVAGGSQPTLRLRNQARSYEDRLRQEFDRDQEPVARLSVVLTYLDETSGKVIAGDEQAEAAFAASEDLLVHFGNGAAKMAVTHLADAPELSLACLAVHAEVAAREVPVARPSPQAAAKVLGRLDDPVLLAQALPEPLLLRTLAYLRSVLPERWPSVYAAVLTRGSRRVCDAAGRALVEAGQAALLGELLRQVVDRPTSSPEAMCWLWRARLGTGLGKILDAIPSLTAADILTSLLNLADATGKLVAVSGEDRHRKVLDSAQQALAFQGAQPVADVFAAAAGKVAARFKQLVAGNNGLAPGFRNRLLRMLRQYHGDLFAEDARPWEEDIIYTTDTGLNKRQAELDEILREQIPAVARQIGEAAAFGDLSENSEFTAALEKRDQLTSRATAMAAELKQAKLISTEMAASSFVNIGSQVQVRRLPAGQVEAYTFLGPWDADADRHILNYNAPLALAFMGKKVGEEVVYDQDGEEIRWEILAIASAL